MKILDEKDVERLLDIKECIGLMEKALVAIENKECTQYVRTAMQLPNQNILGLMPSYFNDAYFGVKVLSVYPKNSLEGYPSHQGEILLFKNEHGTLEALIDAMSVTKIRTGCVSALATQVLSNQDSHILALLGCGHQAISHLEAITKVRNIDTIYVWDLYEQRAIDFKQLYPKLNIIVCKEVKDAVKDADIICTLTPSKEPIVTYDMVKKGCHINAVGSCNPVSREIDSNIVKNSLFYGDHLDSVMKEAGDFLIPLQEGIVTKDHFKGTLAQVILNKIEGRTSHDDLTVFEALGLASEDIICAMYLVEKEG